MKKVFIRTFGCQMNEYDSERMEGILFDNKYNIVSSEKEADIIIVNTCSVRKHAEDRELSYIGKYIKDKKVIVTGCMAQRMQEELIKRFPSLHAVVGTNSFSKIVDIIENKNGKRIYVSEKNEENYIPGIRRKKTIKGYVAIMRGCNNFCSYCIVPYVRGREVSRSVDSIITEIKNMVNNGYKEIMLLGQNVNSYYDKENNIRFPDLLEKVSQIDGLLRIKFMTSHPKDLTEELIDVVSQNKNIYNHFHLPVQSGSNKILKLMNRKYTREEYIEKIKKIRDKIKDVAITTDILLGFPGEEEKDFFDTVSLIKEIQFDEAFVFKYSPREGTKAYNLKETLTEEEKLKRVNYVLDLQKNISENVNKRYLNKIYDVLVYGQSYKNKDELKTSTDTDKKVFVKGSKDLTGKIVKVKITRMQRLSFKGEIVNEN